MLVSIPSDKQHTPTSYRRLTPQRHLNESPAPTGQRHGAHLTSGQVHSDSEQFRRVRSRT